MAYFDTVTAVAAQSGSAPGGVSGTVLAAGIRKYVYFRNTSGTAVVWLGFGAGAGGSAKANQGVMLAAFGSPDSTYEMSVRAGNLFQGVVQGIAPIAGLGTATLTIAVGS